MPLQWHHSVRISTVLKSMRPNGKERWIDLTENIRIFDFSNAEQWIIAFFPTLTSTKWFKFMVFLCVQAYFTPSLPALYLYCTFIHLYILYPLLLLFYTPIHAIFLYSQSFFILFTWISIHADNEDGNIDAPLHNTNTHCLTHLFSYFPRKIFKIFTGSDHIFLRTHTHPHNRRLHIAQ